MKNKETLASIGVGIGVASILILSRYALETSEALDQQQGMVQDDALRTINESLLDAVDSNENTLANPLIIVHKDKQTALTELLLENSLLLEPICSSLSISVDNADIIPDTESAFIAEEIRAAEGQTEVNLCLDPDMKATSGNQLTFYASTQPELIEGPGRASLFLSLQEPGASTHCNEAMQDMVDAISARVEDIQPLHTITEENIAVRISQDYDHPCDLTTIVTTHQVAVEQG